LKLPITDLDRDIMTIRYNLLNLPTLIQFRNGSQIKNRYAADGRKLETEFLTASVQLNIPLGDVANLLPAQRRRSGTIYAGNKEYMHDDSHWSSMGNTILNRIHNVEGYIDFEPWSWGDTSFRSGGRYNYFRRDHLGSVREVWRAPFTIYEMEIWEYPQPSATVQRTQYYALTGLPWSEGFDTWSPSPAFRNNRKHNSCEFIEMHGYDVTDHGNRGFYHAIGRYTTMDRFAEKFPWQSPYAHAANNPVRYIDVNGDSTYHINVATGHVTMAKATNDRFDQLYVTDKKGNVIDGISPLRVNDQSILSGLSEDRGRYSYSVTGRRSDAFNVFKFASDNTSVEWTVAGYRTESGSNEYFVGRITTDENKRTAPNPNRLEGFDVSNMVFMMHSHPGEAGTRGASFLNPGEIGPANTDMNIIRNMYSRLGRDMNKLPVHYIYHPHSKNLYHYTPWESSIFIRHTRSGNCLYRNLGL